MLCNQSGLFSSQFRTYVKSAFTGTFMVSSKIEDQRLKFAPQDPLTICKSVRAIQKTLKLALDMS
jgi:hypothetical protein